MWKIIIVIIVLLFILVALGTVAIMALPDLIDAMIETKEKWQELKRMGGKK